MRFTTNEQEDLPGKVELRDWRVYQTQDGMTHLIGIQSDAKVVRVSTPVCACDQVYSHFRSESGRIYVLLGMPGTADVLLASLQRYMRRHGIGASSDATTQVWERLRLTRH